MSQKPDSAVDTRQSLSEPIQETDLYGYIRRVGPVRGWPARARTRGRNPSCRARVSAGKEVRRDVRCRTNTTLHRPARVFYTARGHGTHPARFSPWQYPWPPGAAGFVIALTVRSCTRVHYCTGFKRRIARHGQSGGPAGMSGRRASCLTNRFGGRRLNAR